MNNKTTIHQTFTNIASWTKIPLLADTLDLLRKQRFFISPLETGV